MQLAFSDFLHRLPFYGLAVLCTDDAEVAALAAGTPRQLMTYGTRADADVRAENIIADGGRMHFNLHLPRTDAPVAVTLALPGLHNVLNALAAAAVGWQLGVEAQSIARAFAQFGGVGRRFDHHGEIAVHGGHAMLVDDYGHHPRELAATFEAVRRGWPERRLVVGFQPHRYSRTRDLLDDFAEVLSGVDVLVLSDVYAAGESPIANADTRALARAIRARGRVEPVLVAAASDIPAALGPLVGDGDLVLLAGAGDISHVAQDLAALRSLPGAAS